MQNMQLMQSAAKVHAHPVVPGMLVMQGAVLCLAQAAQFLFSGGQDTTIKVWRFDADSQAFQPLVCFIQLCICIPGVSHTCN